MASICIAVFLDGAFFVLGLLHGRKIEPKFYDD